MQKINYNEKITLNENIDELLLINIDDKLTKSNENECIKVSGEIKISGEVNCNNKKKSFEHSIDVDILLSKDQLLDNDVDISVEDFNYKIEENAIYIEIILRLEGLREIEPYFPSPQDQEIVEIDREETIDEKIEEEKEILDEIISPIDIEETHYQENNEPKQYSLLKQVFKNKEIKKDTTYLLHVVKKETTYKEISSIYNIDENVLKEANNNEEIYSSKLIFIPKSK